MFDADLYLGRDPLIVSSGLLLSHASSKYPTGLQQHPKIAQAPLMPLTSILAVSAATATIFISFLSADSVLSLICLKTHVLNSTVISFCF